jgi:hypothetical protein
MAGLPSISRREIRVRVVIGSVVFLLSLYLMRQVLVETGLLSPMAALVFLVAAVGIPLGGIVFLEGAFDHEYRKLDKEVRALREEVRQLRDGTSEPDPS